MRVASLTSIKTWAGLLLVFGLGVISWWLAQFVPSLGNVTLAIILGVIAGNLIFRPSITQVAGRFAEKQVLPLSIVLLGVELQLMTLVSLGPLALVIILISILTSLFVAVKLGAWLGFSRSFSLLIGAGNGICGSSAVAATSISIKADESETGISIGVVNLLGTIGIFFVPLIVHWVNLDNLGSGLLIGGTLQAFGQVIASGFSISPEVGQIATVVKMGRVLMLGPMVIAIGFWLQSKQGGRSSTGEGVYVPQFIWGFFLMSILASLNWLPDEVVSVIVTTGKFLLVVAMAGIGLNIHLRTLFRSGLIALLFGATVWLVQIAVTLVMIVLLAG